MDGEAALAAGRLQDAPGHEGHAKAAGDRAHDGLDGAELQKARGDDAAAGQHLLEPLAVGAAGAQHDDLDVAAADHLVQLGHRGRGPDGELFLEDGLDGEVGMLDRAADEGALQPALDHVVYQLARGARAQHQIDLGPGLGVGLENGREAERRRGLERADGEPARRASVIDGGAPGVVQQAGDPAGVGQQATAGGGQGDAPAVALEQRRAEARLELADAGGHVGLHGVELRRRPVHAAEPRHRLEDPEVAAVHDGPASLRDAEFNPAAVRRTDP